MLCRGLVWPNGPPAWRNICFPSRTVTSANTRDASPSPLSFTLLAVFCPRLDLFCYFSPSLAETMNHFSWLSSCLAVFFLHTFQLPCGKCPIQRKLGMAVIITSRPSWVITLWQERQWWQVRAAGLRVSANKEGKKEEERRFSWGEETWKAPRTTYLSEFKYENKQIPWQISCFFSIIFVKM